MYTTCRHIMPSGLCCQSPAMRGSAFCYFHGRRIPPRGKRPSNEHRIEMPAILDGDGIDRAIQSVLQGLAEGHISARRASILLVGLRMAGDHRADCDSTSGFLPDGLLNSILDSDEAVLAMNALAEKLGLASANEPPRAASPKP